MSHRMLRSSFTAVVFLALVTSAHGHSLYVASNGIDGPGCGAKKSPCRSISRAANINAADGDKIIVGPGSYGDLNGNGTLDDSPGEENGAFGCVLLIGRPVTILSSDGAAATIIDGRLDDTSCNVGILAGVQFGSPGKGFLVTNTASASGAGIVVNATNVKVRGNQIIATGMGSSTFGVGGPGTFSGIGIQTVDAAQTILIEGNQVIGWQVGIYPLGAGKTVRKNVLALNNAGLVGATAGIITGNVALVNGVGIGLGLAASCVGNAVYGNLFAGLTVNATPFTGVLEKNNFIGNGSLANSGTPNCGLYPVGPIPGAVVAMNNYWGTALGPGPDPGDVTCSAGATTTAPFATKPFKVKAPIKP